MVDTTITNYIRIASALSRLICAKFSVTYPLQPRRRGLCEQSGKLNKKIEFEYHGIGCFFQSSVPILKCQSLEIDIDYFDEYIVLDPWKISEFSGVDQNVFKSDILKYGVPLKNAVLKENSIGIRFDHRIGE